MSALYFLQQMLEQILFGVVLVSVETLSLWLAALYGVPEEPDDPDGGLRLPMPA